jgi:hypothetical protein
MELGRVLFGERSSPQQLVAMGFPAEMIKEREPLVCYPDHELAYRCFIDNASQWRAGMGGIYALDYNVIYRWLDAEGINKRKRNQVLREVGLLERGALEALQARREAQDRSRQK